MTSIANKENEKINLAYGNENKENAHNNLDDLINKQINIAKNHKEKQNLIKKGLNVIDQNNNCIKKTITFNPENNNKIGTNYNPLLDNLNNNIFDNENIINIDIDSNLPKMNDSKMELTSNSDINILDSSKENENILIFNSPDFLKEDDESLSEHQRIGEELLKIEHSLVQLNINSNKMYNTRESNNLLLKCGESSYKYNKVLEESVFNIPSNFLERHKVYPYIRTKMVDWMIEVLNVFEGSEETFFLSVNIMDLFFWKTPNIYRNENVHLIGVGSMFIASKFQEIYPICLKDFVERIGHNSFKENDVKRMEFKILKDIKPENLVTTSIYDFNKTYFYDFYYNNRNLITSEDDKKIFKYIKMTSIYLNKLILHYEMFYQEKCSIKAIGCIVASLKILSDNLREKFSSKAKGIYNDWMLFLISQGGFNKQKVESLANKIFTAYLHYQKSKSINRNLNRFTPLPYINKK